MAGISTRGSYGLAAMVELARLRHDRVVQIGRIAQTLGLSQNYMEQIFASLRKGGLVESTRGAQGGYRLAADPSEITVRRILEVLEGEICDIAEPAAGGKGLELFWQERQEAIATLFSISLADLLCYDLKAASRLIYHI